MVKSSLRVREATAMGVRCFGTPLVGVALRHVGRG